MPRQSWVRHQCKSPGCAKNFEFHGAFLSFGRREQYCADQKRPVRAACFASSFDEALRRSNRKFVVIVGDPEHRLLLSFVAHLLGQDAAFFGSLAPMIWVIEVRRNGHGANSTSLRFAKWGRSM